MGRGNEGSNRWTIILSGGEGERLRPFVRKLLGRNRPKQYCAFNGGRTMLEHTLARAARFAPPERTITIIGRGHRTFIGENCKTCRIIEQPANRDTGPGIFLPALHALATDPSATLLIFPSDHFISPTDLFVRRVHEAAAIAERQSDRLVLLGAMPDSAEPDYGWIEPDRNGGGPATEDGWPVASFHEKPDESAAQIFLKGGYLWNTMIIAVKAKTLWELGHSCLPQMMKEFEAVREALGTERENLALSVVYGVMPPFNFSRDILERSAKRIVVLPMHGIEWSDWGRPSRIEQTLSRIGKAGPFMNQIGQLADRSRVNKIEESMEVTA